MLEVDANKIAVFKEMVEQCIQRGIKLYVVYSPIYLEDAEREEIIKGQQMCSEYGLPFLDFSKNPEFLNNPQLFHEISYLNHEGATLFSRRLLEILKN